MGELQKWQRTARVLDTTGKVLGWILLAVIVVAAIGFGIYREGRIWRWW